MQIRMQQMAGMGLPELKQTARVQPDCEPTVEQLLTAPLWTEARHAAWRDILRSRQVAAISSSASTTGSDCVRLCGQDTRITSDSKDMLVDVAAEGLEIIVLCLSGMPSFYSSLSPAVV